MKIYCYLTPRREFCPKLIPAYNLAACGHRVLVPCKLENTGTAADFVQYCRHPCDEIITDGNCGHKCKGNCSSCFQGRIHQRCKEKCGRNLPCGHSCTFPCASLCPPCQQQCDMKCEHSKCFRECGFPCNGCNEPCGWSCSHEKCTKRCREKCDRKPCNLPCSNNLEKCGHLCIGLCGEKCPPLCRICDSEEVKEIFFGTEDEPDARFIYLEDCKHIVEVEGMDMHMETSIVENGVSVKKCPKCHTVIQNCKRYSDILRNGRNDVLAIKRKIKGMNKGLENKIMEMALALYYSKEGSYLPDFFNYLRNKCYTIKIEYSFKNDCNESRISPNPIDQYVFESLDNMMMWWTNASKELNVAEKIKPEDQLKLTLKYQTIFEEVMKRLLPLSQREIKDFDRELQKISAWHKLYRRAAIENFSSLAAATRKHITVMKFLVNIEVKPFTPELKEQFSKCLADLDGVIIRDVKNWREDEERLHKEIFKAVGFGAQHWYKCPNGHFYVIANCGQPNEASTCPECKSNIGSASSGYHTLAPGNTRANMDIWKERNIPVPDLTFLGGPSS